jgi:hypothetical protein
MSDVMFYGVLQMPFEMAMDTHLSRLQFHGRVQEALARLAAAEEDAERYRYLREGRAAENILTHTGAELDKAIDDARAKERR